MIEEKVRLFSLPVTDPVLIFTIILFIVLMVPVLLRKSRIPSIVGLILMGIIIGPNTTNLVGDSEIVELFSTVGLLYIMFLAGLGIEFAEFKRNSVRGIVFGLSSFLFPFLMGYFAALHILSMGIMGSLLTGALLASNTLIAYPTAGKLGIAHTGAVNIAISGTLIADTLVLVLLAVVTSLIGDQGDGFPWKLIISAALLMVGIFYILPKLATWFFKTITTDGNLQFLFAIAILFASAVASEIAGIEPIIGVFFAGLTLNRLIPVSSTLMNRLDFVGNTLFIPVFLISVGMIVDLKVLFMGIWPFLYAMLLITIALAGKWLAAGLTSLLFKLNKNEMNTIFGLTTARAAATLVVALVALEYGLISSDIFNAVILLIMATSLFSSYLTEKAGMALAISERKRKPDKERADTVRFLVPIANPANVEKLIDLSILMQNPKSTEAINTLAIVKDDREAETRINYFKPILDKLTSHAAASGKGLRGITRLDVNIPNAIVRASKELGATDILMGWSERTFELKKFFGNLLESVVNGTSNTVIVSHLPESINTSDIIRVSVAAHAEMEKGFRHWLNIIANLSNELTTPIIFHAPEKTGAEIMSTIKKLPKYFNATLKDPIDLSLPDPGDDGDLQPLYIVISARPYSISYDSRHWDFTYSLPSTIKGNNLLIIYPQQFE